MSERTNDIVGLGLPGRLEHMLREKGLISIDDLCAWNAREIQSISGVGPKSLAHIIEALEGTGSHLAQDPLQPYVCARHGASAWDTRLSSFMLCDDCLSEFHNAFRGAAPQFDQRLFGGFCQNCNSEFDRLHLAQWLLCGTCDRVARSIGRGKAAETHMLQEFGRVMNGTGLMIEQVDTPVLRPLGAQNSPDNEAAIDFLIRDGENTLAGIELKTGRNHLGGWAPVGSKIGQFQLDHGDCDAMTVVAERDSILVYLLHAQVIDRVEPPTTRFEATGLWWIDPFSFSESYRSSRSRPRETKTAAYFSTDLFRPFEEFRVHVDSGALVRLIRRLRDEGPPALYPTDRATGADD